METPVMALKRLKVPYEHMFSCDIDKNVKTQILENFPPKIWYDDLMTRKNRDSSTPAVDIYVAGFPCQSFSNSGLGLGFDDKRGMVFYGCADYIDSKRPRAFILENVKGLIGHDGGETFKKVKEVLGEIGRGAYEVTTKLLNSQDHGVPQSRPRIYIVGIRRDCKQCDFSFPESLPRVSIEGFLDPVVRKPTMADLPPKSNKTAHRNVKEVLRSLTAQGLRPLTNTHVIDIDASAKFRSVMHDRTMCMTKSRAAGFWVTSRGRRMNKDEMLRCQGMERSFKQVVSDRALGMQIGNAMGQNIIERLLVQLLPAAGLVSQDTPLQDRWRAASRRSEAKGTKRSASSLASGSAQKRARKA
jgi:DNA (cytosine-5)-methyltransferase 1